MLDFVNAKTLEFASKIKAISSRDEGQALVEYALILVLVSIAGIAFLTLIGTSVGTVLSKINDALQVP
jgi:pilus assembly protein Flp/PilA